jgi:hypothetical protein
MKKLIKLSNTHYVIISESTIREYDWVLDFSEPKRIFQATYTDVNNINSKSTTYRNFKGIDNLKIKRIIGSTQPLNNNFNDWFDVQIIPISDVERLIYGYSVGDMLTKLVSQHIHTRWLNSDNESAFNSTSSELDYISGYKAHQELVKDKLFTVEDLYSAFNCGRTYEIVGKQGVGQNELIDYINSLKKTEWEIEFDETGKIKLK